MIYRFILILGVLSSLLLSCQKEETDNELPRRYDLRDMGFIPGVREQAWGTCWAFATALSLETNLMRSGHWLDKNSKPHLSPYHIDKYSGFTRMGKDSHVNSTWYSGQGSRYQGSNRDDPNSGLIVHLGGDFYTSTAFLTNTKGAVPASKTPTIPRKGDHKLFGDLPTEGVLWENDYTYYFPRDIIWLTKEGSPKEKQRKIKEAIINHGAVATIQVKKDSAIGFAPDGLPIHGQLSKDEKPDHAINLIGWNDDLLYKGHYGAWLAQDSDHRTKDDKPQGFFYVLYDDVYVGKDAELGGVSFQDVQRTPFSKVYSHSLHGQRYVTHKKSNIEMISNRYVAQADHLIKGVGLYSNSSSVSFKLELKSKLSGKAAFTKNGTIRGIGFHYLDLKEHKLEWKKNQENFVVLSLSDGQYAYDASSTIELLLGAELPAWGKPIQVNSKASPNESFFKTKGGQWKDFSTFVSSFNGQSQHPHAKDNPTANFAVNLYVD